MTILRNQLGLHRQIRVRARDCFEIAVVEAKSGETLSEIQGGSATLGGAPYKNKTGV